MPGIPNDVRVNHFKLGVGTIWMGRRWPMENKTYVPPTKTEAFEYLDAAYRAGVRHIDTAAAYGDAEKVVGDYCRANPHLVSELFIATKWGEEFDLASGKSRTVNSLNEFLYSLARSLGLLPKIDLLYFHKPSIEVLGDDSIRRAFADFKAEGKIRFSGISVSNPDLLESLLTNNLLWTDYLQTSFSAVVNRPDLIEAVYSQGIRIVVNAPVRSALRQGIPIEEVFKLLMNNTRVDLILTGTRTHLEQTLEMIR